MRILALAYACEPGKGSEPEAGWIWSRILARFGPVHVVTRRNNRNAIEAAISKIPERENLTFSYVDLPRWMRFWKRGQRGIRLYYTLWQFTARREMRRLRKQADFDLAWHLTLANVWLGSVVSFSDIPTVLGPIGGGIPAPWRAFSALGFRGVLQEVARSFARWMGRYLNPRARTAWVRASVILVQNRETRNWLPRKHRSKCVILPNVAVEMDGVARGEASRSAIYAGKLLPLKGVSLGIEAVARTPGWRLIICGEGKDGSRLRKLIHRLGVESRVEFAGWLPRQELMQMMGRDASVLLFPSLHEEGGMVVAEALVAGLPVLTLDVGGPPVLAGDVGVQVRHGTRQEIVAQLAEALERNTFPAPDEIRKQAQSNTMNARASVVERVLASILPNENAEDPGTRSA